MKQMVDRFSNRLSYNVPASSAIFAISEGLSGKLYYIYEQLSNRLWHQLLEYPLHEEERS